MRTNTIVGVLGIGVAGIIIVAAIYQGNKGGQTGVVVQGSQTVQNVTGDLFKA